MKLKIIFTIVVLLTISSIYGNSQIFAVQNPDEDCTDCIVNDHTQILTIFNFETEENPFLAKKATFLISPNPFMHNLAADSIDPQKFGVNLIITDNDSLDSDPMQGVIELIGVNPGMYNIIELKGPPGFLKTTEAFSSDEIFGETYSHVHVTNFLINPSSITTSINMDSPFIDESILLALQNFHAMIGGVSLTLPDQMPASKMTKINALFSGSAPNHIKFGNTANGLWNTLERFTNLGIPKYPGPSSTISNSDLAFIPPLFVTENDDDSNFVMSPILEELSPGTNLFLRLDETDTETSSGSSITGLNLPLDTFGEDVGVSLQIHDEPPANFPELDPNIADSSVFLDFSSVGNIDFTNPGSFSDLAKVYFNLPSNGMDCPNGVQVFLLNKSTNQWESVSPPPVLNPSANTPQSCGYVQNLEHFSSYAVGTGFDGGTSGGSTGGGDSNGDHDHDHDDDHDHGGGGHSHGGHSHSHGAGGHGDGGHDHDALSASGVSLGYEISEGTSDYNRYQSSTTPGGQESSQDDETLEFGGIIKEQEPKLEFGRPYAPNTLKFGEKLYDESLKFAPDVSLATLTLLGLTSSDYGYDFGTTFSGTRMIVDVHEKTFPIKYSLNGQITKMSVNQQDKSISFLLENVVKSDLLLRLPRALIDAQNNQFIVTVTASPESLVDYSVFESNSEYVTLKLNVPNQAKQLTIIGTNVVPEFGVFAMLVFLVALSATVLLFRSKFAMVSNIRMWNK